ncbi:Uncharacterized protein FWK35_00016079 [Aphis craccivora]|uniref:Myb/SANT-like domain-containing protein n=1 Tax=Aphis craccivora TaxID=307492 RepID=A0A6G0ZAZ3_APHCR|nr:Uncharacterized protein FWK35_00016079 [Aphis craccivora]
MNKILITEELSRNTKYIRIMKSPKKRKRISRSAQEVKDLLAIFKEKNIMSALDLKRYRNGEILGGVQIEIKAKGYNKTIDRIRAKWKALKDLYKDTKYFNWKSGHDRKDGGEWGEELDELLKTRPSVKPLELIPPNWIINNDYTNYIDIVETSSTAEGPELSTEIINLVKPAKPQKKCSLDYPWVDYP